MASIRARLTATYAAALVATMVVFGATLWVGRGANELRDLEHVVTAETKSARWLTSVVRVRNGVRYPMALTEIRDSLVGPKVIPDLYAVLEALPDFVILADSTGFILYGSAEARLLVPGAKGATGILDAARRSQSGIARLTIERDTDSFIAANWKARGLPQSDEVLTVRTVVDSTLAPIRYIIAASSTGPGQRAQQELLGSMLAIAPFVLLISVGVAYYMAGNALRPLEFVRSEVEAITDGRSLHRRLQVEESGDELARLSSTLNDMIGRLETSFGGLRRFTADASHELKTPLTVLRANVERAMSVPSGAPDQLVALEEALHETTRMADLVDSLLTLARFDEGRFDLHRERVELEPLIRDVFETAGILGEEASLEITLPVCENASVLGDPARLRQLFLNLVTNAIKYTPSGGTVELTLRRLDDTVVFAVRDTGIGIAAADLPYIFERFWRADRARSRRTSGDGSTFERAGFGLGLAISQWIAQAHGGTLTVVSRLTRGTTFTVSLPQLLSATASAAPAMAAV